MQILWFYQSNTGSLGSFSLSRIESHPLEMRRLRCSLSRSCGGALMVSCLQCGAYDDRYCGCWQDRAPGFCVSEPPGPSVVFKALFIPIHRRTHLQHYTTPILPNRDVRGHDTVRIGLDPRGVRGGQRPPVLARARSAHALHEGGGWV